MEFEFDRTSILDINTKRVYSQINGEAMSGFKKTYQAEVLKGLTRLSEISILNKNDVEHLPLIIKKYLFFCGCIGKPRVLNFHAEFIGRMKQKQNGNWMNIAASQYNFYDVDTRLFYIK